MRNSTRLALLPILALVVALAAGCAPKKATAAAAAAVPQPALLPAEASSLLQAVGMQIPKNELAATGFHP